MLASFIDFSGIFTQGKVLLNSGIILAKSNCSLKVSKENNLRQGGNPSTLLSTLFTLNSSSNISVTTSGRRDNSKQKKIAVRVVGPDLRHGGKMLHEDRTEPSHPRHSALCR